MSEYMDLESNRIKLGLHGSIQYMNSSLALQIAKYWLEKVNSQTLTNFSYIQENTDKLDVSDLSILKPVLIDDKIKDGNDLTKYG